MKLADPLLDRIHSLGSVVVAYSGGVDSAVVAKAARLALGPDKCIAATASSESLPMGELENAQAVAAEIGIGHHIIETHETSNPNYVANRGNRCFWCKDELYRQLIPLQKELGFSHIVNGTNADDLDDYRPGIKAARNHDVVSPLAECDLSKQQVREIAQLWNLRVWNKPAGPCLSSRIAPGVSVTADRLQRIDRAEAIIRSMGFDVVRVRLHQNELARIEIPEEKLNAFLNRSKEINLNREFEKLGFRFVTIDMLGFRSGSMNQLVQLDSVGSQ